MPVASVGLDGTAHVVAYDGSVTLTGTVVGTDGAPEVGRAVVLLQHTPGGGQARVVERTTTDDSGAVELATPAAAGTATYRLRSGHRHSDAWRVAMRPGLTVTPTTAPAPADGSGQGSGGQRPAYVVTLQVQAQGTTAGDGVQLLTRRHQRPVVVGRQVVDADGTATFTVRSRKAHVHYAVVLAATKQHTRAVQVTEARRPA